jgi:hypothetical protein
MRRREACQVLGTLAMSFLVLCVLHPYPGFLLTGLESLLLLLVLSALILFVVNQTSALYRLAVAGALCLAGFVSPRALTRPFVGDLSADTFPISEPVLPFRFQLPPPYLSI